MKIKRLNKVQLIIFKKTRDKLWFLLLKRAISTGDIWQGVTGGIERFDKHNLDACVRELREELGLLVSTSSIIGPFAKFNFITQRKGYEGEVATEHIYAVQVPNNFTPNLSSEHSEFKWFDAVTAMDFVNFDESKNAIKWVHERYS